MKIDNFQQNVRDWVIKCFGIEIADNITERNYRFLEEALELVQSTGCSKEKAHELVDYVYSRPVGETYQEIGGVMVTLASLCAAKKESFIDNALIELIRIDTPEVIEKIRIKQSKKPIQLI